MAANPPLEVLRLTNNHLDDNDAVMIARALKQNTNLDILCIDQNDITDTGRDAIRTAIFDSTSLNAMADSNHSCRIMGIKDFYVKNNVGGDSNVNRGRKIYSLLSSWHKEGVNVRHLNSEFDDDELKLVPKVLESVHHCAEYCYSPEGKLHYGVHPLSITYEILRNWKMPSLYEKNGQQNR